MVTLRFVKKSGSNSPFSYRRHFNGYALLLLQTESETLRDEIDALKAKIQTEVEGSFTAFLYCLFAF